MVFISVNTKSPRRFFNRAPRRRSGRRSPRDKLLGSDDWGTTGGVLWAAAAPVPGATPHGVFQHLTQGNGTTVRTQVIEHGFECGLLQVSPKLMSLSVCRKRSGSFSSIQSCAAWSTMLILAPFGAPDQPWAKNGDRQRLNVAQRATALWNRLAIPLSAPCGASADVASLLISSNALPGPMGLPNLGKTAMRK